MAASKDKKFRLPSKPREKAPEPVKASPKSDIVLSDEVEDDWGFGDDDDGFGSSPTQETKAIERELTATTPQGRSWQVAAGIVSRYRPVPRLVWPLAHAIFGKPGELGKPDVIMFSSLAPLLLRAAQDRTFTRAVGKSEPAAISTLGEAVEVIGIDVAAALCIVHSVCRRVASTVNERVSRPILDDALLRTHIGYHVGHLSGNSGAGRGMLAGFAGRCGLAVQIAAGDKEQASRALTGMASGHDMSKVCNEVYGCDPLEVAALSLISGGCCREIALGISSYSNRLPDTVPGTEQFRWLSLFTVIEGTRMGQASDIGSDVWNALSYDSEGREELSQSVMASQRRGHGWHWLTEPQGNQAGEPSLSPQQIRDKQPKE